MCERFTKLLLSATKLLACQEQIENFFDKQILKHSFIHPNGLTLSAFELPGNPDDCLVIIPGRGEIAHKYAEFLYSLRSLNKRIVLLFARGQGASTRLLADHERCHIDNFAYFREDIQFLLAKLKIDKYKLLAFSLGSLISLDLIVKGHHLPQRAALMAPYVYPYFPLPRPLLGALILTLGALPITKIAYTPHGQGYKRKPFLGNDHSHCEIRYKLYHDYYASHPDLTIGGPTWGFLRQAYLTQSRLLQGDFQFKIPIMTILAGHDKVVSTKVAYDFFKQHEHDPYGVKIVTIDNAYHDLLNEADEYRLQSLPQALDFLENGENNVR